MSNRVTRHFLEHTDRFLRVAFVDENFGSVLGVRSDDFFENRMREIMHKGFLCGGRRFVFLAFSNSQIREQSCWFYDETEARAGEACLASPSAQDIRDWIGELSSIKIPGKFASRLGQGFSATFRSLDLQIDEIVYGPDIERHGFCFSDGVGVIAQSLAQQIAKSMGLKTVPSAFQIRLGGAKGMLTVMPDAFLNGKSILIRNSMVKFQSTHLELGINSWSKAIPMYLNRQLITLLSAREICDETFMKLFDDMTEGVDMALTHNNAAKELMEKHTNAGNSGGDDVLILEESHGITHPATRAWHMLDAGIDVRTDTHLQGLIGAVRSKLLLDLQTKCRIFVPQAVCLIGVIDETFSLQPDEVFIQLSSKLPGTLDSPDR